MSVAGGSADKGALADVREGMEVVDRLGERVGTVEFVRMGDPEAVTAEGQEPDRQTGEHVGLVGEAARAIFGTEPELPAPLAERMLRLGFIKIDTLGLLGHDSYAGSDQIEAVDGWIVRLGALKNELVTTKP